MKRIWVVEDDESIREVITLMLEEEGYQVSSFENASQFRLALSADCKVADAIMMDVMLPDGNGLFLCHQVKSNERFAKVPVLMMSANTTFSEVERFSNADEFMPKPFDLNDMLKKVDRLTA